MKLTKEQKRELVDVFRAESVEHIKVMAELFFSLGEGKSNKSRKAINKAFREAHSLKGAAGTLGFVRIEALTHKLEDVLGVLSDTTRIITSETVDLLLTSLDTIRISADEARPGDKNLSEKELNQIKRLEEFLGSHSSKPISPRQQSSWPSLVRTPSTGTAPSEDGTFGLEGSQMKQLAAVFRAESLEHIKNLSEILLALEDGSGDEEDLLTRAFRAAHSMKGSAGTLGYNRCEVITHRLEDVFGIYTKGDRKLTPKIIDALLSVLDVIRNSIESSKPGDSKLTKEEEQTVELLTELATGEEIETKREAKPEAASIPSQETPAEKNSLKSQVEEKATKSNEFRAQRSSGRGSATTKGKKEDTLIRIAESKIDSVIGQFSELFEAKLQMESVGPELDTFCHLTDGLCVSLGNILVDFSGSDYETELFPVVERARSLLIQLRGTASRFEQHERRLSKLIQSSQDELRSIRMAPVSSVFIMLKRQIREASKVTGKKLELSLGGGEYAVDRKVLDAIEDPLVHILRNAASHGIESPSERNAAGKNPTGQISVVARHTGDAVEVTVADDGGGIDLEKIRQALLNRGSLPEATIADYTDDQLLDNLFESGFSTQKEVTKISGRGVGLDVVKYTVERLGGEVRLESRLGRGTSIILRLPLSMSTIRCLLIRAAGRVLAIPAANVEKVVIPSEGDISAIAGSTVIRYGGQNVPLGSLGTVMGLSSHVTQEDLKKLRIVLIISFGDRRFAFGIDELVEYNQLILKPLGDLLERVPNISGVSLLGTGETALVLSPPDLIRTAGGVRSEVRRESIGPDRDLEKTSAKRVLVVDDSITTRKLEMTLLESAGFIVESASDGYKAMEILNRGEIDIVLTDIQMPNMDGIELSQTIKSRSQLSNTPIVLISSLGSDQDKARGLAAGADAYIVKRELTQQELVDTINLLL